MDDDVVADILAPNNPKPDENTVAPFQESDEGPMSNNTPPKQRGRPREKTIDKDKFIRYILRDIGEHLENIYNKSFQNDVKKESILIGKKLDELATILEIKVR